MNDDQQARRRTWNPDRDGGRPIRFTSPHVKLTIGSLEDSTLTVQAQFNPKEVQLDRQVPWGEHNVRDNRPVRWRVDTSEYDAEYTGAPGRTLTLELMFDHYELPDSPEKPRSVEPILDALDEMACVKDPASSEDDDRRPHHCVVTWGAGSGMQGLRPFRCVIESISSKLTMFDRDGTPVRAVATVKLREANVLKVGKQRPAPAPK